MSPAEKADRRLEQSLHRNQTATLTRCWWAGPIGLDQSRYPVQSVSVTWYVIMVE